MSGDTLLIISNKRLIILLNNVYLSEECNYRKAQDNLTLFFGSRRVTLLYVSSR
jgi:hypothetical protein